MALNIESIKKLLSGFHIRIKDYSISELTESNDWIKDLELRYRRIKLLIPNYPIKVFLKGYLDKINNYTNANPDLKEIIKKNWISFFCNCDENTKMFMIPIFAMSRTLDDNISKQIMEIMGTSCNKCNRYWSTMNISRLCFRTQLGFYNEFYNDRRNLLKMIAVESRIKIPSKKISEVRRRLCIITYLLSPKIENSMQRVAMMFANNMSKYYDETLVLCIESCYSGRKENRVGYTSLYNIASSSKHKDSIEKLFSKEVKIYISKGKTYIDRMQDSIDVLYSFNPSLIIDLSDEFSPLSYYYSKDYYTAYFPLRGSASSQFYSSFIGNKRNIIESNKKFSNCVDESRIIEWNFPEYVPEEQGIILRNTIGIDDDSFCIISIGNHVLYSKEFIDEVCILLENHKHFVWLLVGSNVPQYLIDRYDRLFEQNRIINWGHEQNLAGICKSCDVLLRYNTTGGSGGTAIAAMQGLPVVMTNYNCDASRWLGVNYSNFITYHELMDEIIKLSTDKQYYDIRSNLTFELVKNAIDNEEKWHLLHDLLIEDKRRNAHGK